MVSQASKQPKVNVIQHASQSGSKKSLQSNSKLKAVDDSGNAALLTLLKIEAEARGAQTQSELIFLIANEMRKLTSARQTFVIRQKSGRGLTIEGVNSLDSVDRDR